MPEALFMVFLSDAKGAKVSFSISVLFSKRRINVNLVDLVKSFQAIQTSIYLQNLASIQPRTGLSKFAKNQPKVKEQI